MMSIDLCDRNLPRIRDNLCNDRMHIGILPANLQVFLSVSYRIHNVIVSDEEVPGPLKNDAELWSGCIAGAFTEEGFLRAFENAGFYGMEIVKRDDRPWQTIAGIEFRSVTVVAHKGYERNQAVIYKGPWKTAPKRRRSVGAMAIRFFAANAWQKRIVSMCGRMDRTQTSSSPWHPMRKFQWKQPGHSIARKMPGGIRKKPKDRIMM